MTKAMSSGCRRSRTRLFRYVSAVCDTGGGALIELALIVPIFTILLLGSTEFAILSYDSIEVSNAARAGVAYGSQSNTTASDSAGMRTAATSDAPDVSGISATAKEFWSCSNAPATQASSPPTCTSGNHVLHYVQVTTSATITPGIHLPGLSAPYTLSGLAIMRVQ
jgi:Flp pilus assembly protein TadG